MYLKLFLDLVPYFLCAVMRSVVVILYFITITGKDILPRVVSSSTKNGTKNRIKSITSVSGEHVVFVLLTYEWSRVRIVCP